MNVAGQKGKTAKPPLKVSEIARLKNVHRDTVYGWIRHGVTAPNGDTVRLRAERAGRVIRIKRRWLREFMERCDPADTVQNRAARRASARARAERAAAEFRRRTRGEP